VVLLSDLSSGRRPSEPGQSGLIATGPDGAVVAAILVEAPTGPGGVYRVPDLAATGELRGAGTALMATVAQMAAQEPDGTVEVDAEVGAAGFYEVLGMQPTGKRPHTEVDEALCPMAWTHDQVVEMAALARGHGLTPPPPRPHGLHREL
jgi:GNAT superfamily N-acetyltransferase